MSDKIRRHRIEAEANFPAATFMFSVPDPPPPDDSWYDWPFDDVLGQIYDWFIANLTEIIGVSEKIGQLLGLLRARLPARRIEARLQEAA